MRNHFSLSVVGRVPFKLVFISVNEWELVVKSSNVMICD